MVSCGRSSIEDEETPWVGDRSTNVVLPIVMLSSRSSSESSSLLLFRKVFEGSHPEVSMANVVSSLSTVFANSYCCAVGFHFKT